MIISFEVLLRLTAVLIFVLWIVYWLAAEKDADREKPKGQTQGRYRNLRKVGLRLINGIILLQLLGLPLLPIDAPWTVLFTLQISGFLLILLGVSLSVTARKTLGTNWAHAFDYQIKRRQELITSGVYRYIRHPIYTGLILSMIGAELLSQSYLVFVILVFQPLVSYWQAKSEERLLSSHFGKTYRNYMKRTKMFIPFVW